MSMTLTDEDFAARWNNGLSAAALAVLEGTTKGAALHRIVRLRQSGVSMRERNAMLPVQKTISLPAFLFPPAGQSRPFCVAPPGAHPCATATLPSVVPDCLVSDLPTTEGLSFGPPLGLTTLADRDPHQCSFPLWPNKARHGAPDYGRVCGAPVAPNKAGERRNSYCPHHQSVVSSKAETSKAKRIVRATVRKARAQGVA